jgi:phospholipid/cholesterol/gamma-HCH transport system substrate-binding protein
VEMNLAPDLKLPVDTFANIVTSGVLGGRYIELQPGGEDRMLKPGDTITHVGNAVILEKVIGQLIYGMTKGNNPPTTAPATEPAKSPEASH